MGSEMWVIMTALLIMVAFFSANAFVYRSGSKASPELRRKRWVAVLVAGLPAIAVMVPYALLGPPILDGLFGVYRATPFQNLMGDLGFYATPIALVLTVAYNIWHNVVVEKSKWWATVLWAAAAVLFFTLIMVLSLWGFWIAADIASA